MEIDKIYHGDFYELVKNIPDNSVDCIISDPPFGITKNSWDKKIDLSEMWTQFKRITKSNSAIILFANGKFVMELGSSNLKMYKYKIVVNKHHGTGFLNAKKMPLKTHDDILIFYDKLPTYNPQFFYSTPYIRVCKSNSEDYMRDLRHTVSKSLDGKRYPLDVISFQYPFLGSEKVNHATQKPVKLLEYLIKTYSNEGDLIFDPFLGSGTTAIACMHTAKKFLGFELEERFFNLANDRITKARNFNACLSLFS